MAITPGPRNRSSSYDRKHYYIYEVKDPNGNITFKSNNLTVDFTHSDSMDDVVSENFLARQASGEIINNPMSKTVIETTKVIPYFLRTDRYGWSDYGYTPYYLCETPIPDSPDYSVAVDAAVSKAYAKIDSSIASLPVTLGELRETKEMLVKALVSLRHVRTVLKYYKDKLRFALDARERSSFVASEVLNGWMQVRFGWLPFVGDVKNLHAAMTKLQVFENRQTFRAGEKIVTSYADHITSYLDQMYIEVDRTSYIRTNISVGVLCVQRYGGVPDTYGLTKFPSVLWELTRLSWAIDYFFNVADVIASFTPDSLWSPASSWVTIRTERTDVMRTVGSGPSPGSVFVRADVESGEVIKVTKTVTRTPDPSRGGIHFRPKLNWARYIDMVGVLKSPVKKIIRDVGKLYTKYKGRR